MITTTRSATLATQRKRILTELAKGPATASALGARLGYSALTIHRRLERDLSKGQVVRVGRAPGFRRGGASVVFRLVSS